MHENHDLEDPGDEVMDRLFDLAGRPPALPPEELAPIKADLRRAWRRSLAIGAARRRRRLGFAAAAALAAALAVALGLALYRRPAAPVAAAVATLEAQSGPVTAAAGAAGPLTAGAAIVTGAGGHAALRLASGPSLRLDSESAVRLDSARAVTLRRGAVYIDSGPPPAGRGGAPAGGGVEVATALGTAREIGTQFEVRLLPPAAADGGGDAPAALQVSVREGAVVIGRGGESVRAEAGSALTLTVGGGLERTAVAPDASEWEWVQRAAAPMAIEGATLAAFLDWAARETGRSWRFAPGVPPSAGAMVLHGTIAGLAPEEALSVVLPGCRLRHRVAGGTLHIEAAPPAD